MRRVLLLFIGVLLGLIGNAQANQARTTCSGTAFPQVINTSVGLSVTNQP